MTKGEFELVVGVALDFPFQNRKALGGVAEAEAKIVQLRQELDYLEELVRVEIQDTRSALLTAVEQAVRFQQSATLSEQLAEAERVEFEAGSSTVFFVNQREQKAAEQRAKAISTLAKCWSFEASFRLAQGLPPGTVEAIE